MSKSNLELGFFQETNVPDRIHTHLSEGYRVLAVYAPIWHCRGLAILYQDFPHFQVKDFQPHGPKVTIFQLDSGGIRLLFWVFISNLPRPQPSIMLLWPLASSPMGLLCWWLDILTSTWLHRRGTAAERRSRRKL